MNSRQEFNEIRDTLKHASIKVTHARMIIFQILKRARQELTAYDIEHQSLAVSHRINLATIYSTLKLFQTHGLIQRYKVDMAQALYSLNRSEGSIRVVCEHCGSVNMHNVHSIESSIQQFCSDAQQQLRAYHVVLNIASCQHCQKTWQNRTNNDHAN